VLTPAWILDALAGVMLAVAGVSAARLAGARPWRRGTVVTDTDVGHLLMAIVMAGMLIGGLRTLPGTAWVIIFGILTCWFGYRVARDARVGGVRALAGRHCTPHLVHSGAMVYMFLALPPLVAASAGMAEMGSAGQGLRYPSLAFVFALILAASTVWDLDQLSGRRYRLAPAAVTVGCRIAMSVTMAFMLLIMI
jgi:Domain of unknown function (DUF5134)